MEDVRKFRTPVLITKKGTPVAKLVPPDEPKRDVFGCMAGTATIIGDVKSPLLPPAREMGRVPAPLGRAVSNAAQEGETRAVAQGDAVILLDTHAWLWLGLEPRRLSAAAAAAITHAIGTGGLAIASISLWETALRSTAGRLPPQGAEG